MITRPGSPGGQSSRPVSRIGSFGSLDRSFGFDERPMSSCSMTSLGTVAWSVTADDAPLRLSGGWVRVDQAVDMAGRATTPYYAHPSKRLSQFEEPEVVRSQNKLSLELVKAAKAGSAAEIDALLQKGAEVNCADPMGTSPAMKAATFGNLDALTRLLEEQPDLTLCNEDGRNALHLAVLWGRCLCGGDGGCVGALIRAGCARNQMDDAGEFPIDLSCRALQPTNGQPLPRFPQTAELRQVQKQIQAMAKWLSFLKCASINTDDYDALFDDPFAVMAQLEEGAENAFGVKEKAFTFGTLEKGSAEVTQRVRIANTGTVECSVALSIAPQASTDPKAPPPESAFTIEPSSMIIPRGEDQFATVTFKPAASGKVREVLTASVEGGDIPLEFAVWADVPRDPNEPEPEEPKGKAGKKKKK